MAGRARRHSPGDRGLPATEWNNILARLIRLERLLLGGRQGSSEIAAAAVPFLVKSSDGDTLVCRSFLGGVEATEDIYVAKPYLHRPSLLTWGGQTFSYTNDFERVVSFDPGTGPTTETQVLTPTYFVDDQIFAIRCASILFVHTPTGGGDDVAVEWIQMGPEGRAWAKKNGT